MTKKLLTLIVLVSVLAVFALTVSARVVPPDPRIEKINQFGHAFVPKTAPEIQQSGSAVAPRGRLSGAAVITNSRGALVAQTWRDYQTNTNIGRWVAVTEPASSFGAGVQFTYMAKASAAATDLNRWGWNAYDGISGAFVKPGGSVIVQDNSPGSPEAGSYPKIVINPSNGQGVVGSYNFPDINNSPNSMSMHVSWEALPFSGNFGTITDGTVMADTLNKKGNIHDMTQNTIWPAMAMSCTATDTAIYLFGQEYVSTVGPQTAVKVYRHPGGFNAPAYPDVTWQLVFVDTATFPSVDISASRVSGKIAVAWIKSIPGGFPQGTLNNDVYYATSSTGLSGSWTRHDLTNYVGATYRAYLEVNTLYDSADKLHIVWNAGTTTDGTSITRACRLFHWSEYNPSNFYTMYNANYDVTLVGCIMGQNELNIGSFSLGECNGKLYATFVDWNDPALGITDDCAKSANTSYGANGEVWLVVARDLEGKSWDRPRNLSNNRTPGCDTITGAPGGNCGDDRWSGLSEHGIDDALYAGTENWAPSGASYDPSGSYTGTAYTQVFYLTDRFAGDAVFSGQGPYTNNDLRWIRLACVDPVTAANLAVTPNSIDFPANGKPGIEKDTTIIVENTGNTTLIFNPSIVAVEDSCKGVACAAGWLGTTSAPATIPEATQVSMILKLNVGGISHNHTGPTRFWGHLQMNYGPPDTTFKWPVSFVVADSVANTTWDTIQTSTNIKLAVGSNGNMGENYVGHVNMNFNPPVECDDDTSAMKIGGHWSRGTAATYLGDGSPVIIRKPGTTTNLIASWSIFNQGYESVNGFKPLPPQTPWLGKSPIFKDTTIYQRYFSGTFTTVDSVLKVEKTWYAPKTSADTNSFVIEKLQIWPSTPGAKVDSLYIGEAYDWDIPSDSGTSNNVSNFDATRRLVYQQGIDLPDTISTLGYDCANNSLRLGGSALILQGFKNCLDSLKNDTLWNGYTAANDSFVYPASGFVPLQLYTNMKAPGYSKETRQTDLHTVLTFRATTVNPPAPGAGAGWTLPAQVNDTLTIYSIMGVVRTAALNHGVDTLNTVIDKGKAWAKYYVIPKVCATSGCCIGKRGNVNLAGAIDLGDLSALVSYLTGGGFTPTCPAAANVNGVGAVDLGDLSALVSYLTGGGFVLINCP